MIPGVIYARQSVTRDGSDSLEIQVDTCTEAATRLGIKVVATIVEPPSTSGFKNRGRNRPEFLRQLLPMVASGEAKAILVYKSERLSRGGGPGWAPIWDAYEAGGGKDHDRFVATPNGWMSELEIGIRATMDREESKKMSQRTTDNHRRAAEDGRPRHGGLRPFGYDRDLMTVCEPEAKLIREAASRILRGESVLSIARDWNSQGITTSTGNHWGIVTLKRVLRSGRIAGYRESGGEIIAEAKWPAILDRETWAEVKGLIDRHPRNGQSKKGCRSGSLLLNGFIRCGRCGSRMYARTRLAYGKTRKEYGCQRPETSGQADSCGSCFIYAEHVDEKVLKEAILPVVCLPEWREMVAKNTPHDSGDDEDVMAELADLDRRLKRVNEMYEFDDISSSEHRQKVTGLKEDREKLMARLSNRTEVKLLSSIPTDAKSFRQAWDERGRDWQRLVVGLCVESVLIHPGRRSHPSERVEIVDRSWEGQEVRTNAP